MRGAFITAGALQHLVKIQVNAGVTQDALGEPIPNWVTLITRFASVEPLTGRELWTAQQVQAGVTHKIGMRGHPEFVLSPKNRLIYHGRVFNVAFVRNVEEADVEIEAYCKEQV